ncbi:MAG: metallophosphoesterase [Zoogloeaceae bacterium]|jgi:predicted MPP superfamily phosphohydrolase|nr:metallophosphoesterase [Zoogloeaceae bacterium]
MAIFTLIRWTYVAINIALIIGLYLNLQRAGWGRGLSVSLCLLAVVLSLAFPAARMLEGNGFCARALAFAGTFWLSFVLHTLLLLVLLGVFWCGNQVFHWVCISPERAQYWRNVALWSVIGGAFFISLLGWANTQQPVVRELRLETTAVTRSLRVAALSDLHLGRLVSPAYFSRLMETIAPLRPDMLLLAGDILDDYHGLDMRAVRESLARLQPPLGVWGVLGNHEYIAGDADTSRRLLEVGGIRILRDEWTDVGGQVLLVGRDDHSRARFLGGARRDKTLPEILADAPEALRQRPMIVLDHQPLRLEESEAVGAFLQISGHTHNGQLFPFNFVVRWLYENAHGYSRRARTHYWVSAGVGTWGPRVRTTGRPEIVLIQIDPEPAASAASAAGTDP